MTTIKANSVPIDLILKVTRVADVFQIKLIRRKENPVELLSSSGESCKIDKITLINNFTDINGKRLSLLSMRYNKPYVVCKMLNLPSYAVKLPKNGQFIMEFEDGRKAKPGNIVIIQQAKLVVSGDKADFSQANIIPEKIFKKTCILTGVSESLGEKLNVAGQKVQEQPKQQVQQQQQEKPVVLPSSNPNRNKPIPPIEKIDTAIGEITAVIKKAGSNQTMGYVITSNGTTYPLTVEQTMTFVNQKYISNAMLVKDKNTGKVFLRGNGISLADLPIQYN